MILEHVCVVYPAKVRFHLLNKSDNNNSFSNVAEMKCTNVDNFLLNNDIRHTRKVPKKCFVKSFS